MRLLVVTQKVDQNDPILGFFHEWVKEFAKHCEQVTVIALGVGKYDLPKNVRVFSLGKESRVSQLIYIKRFYEYIWSERENYDIIFVHMNQEYVLLGGLLWKLLGKKITMWRNHPSGNLLTKIAVVLSDKVFCTSGYSYTARYKKTSIMPVGINTNLFFRDTAIERKADSILFLGRISPVKNVEVFINALNILDKEGIDFTASIYGDSPEKDKEYYKKVRLLTTDLEKKEKVFFHGGVPNSQTPLLYNQHELFVNATRSGSFDKTILEAMACECVVVVSNESLKDVLPPSSLFKDVDAIDLARKLRVAISLSKKEKEEHERVLRQYAVRHDITRLAEQLFTSFAELLKGNSR